MAKIAHLRTPAARNRQFEDLRSESNIILVGHIYYTALDIYDDIPDM